MNAQKRKKDYAHEKRMAYLRSIGVGGFVPADRAQRRIRQLHDGRGISFEVIAERTGLDDETIKTHYHGYSRTRRSAVVGCTRRTEAAILGAKFSPADAYRVPALGVRRRLQALQAAGYTLAAVAEAAGQDLTQVHATMQGKASREWVTTKSAETVIAAYEKLESTTPQAMGVSVSGSKKAKTRAAKNGYAPPQCWDPDTIDDPDAHPEWTGKCGTPSGYRVHRREGIPVCQPCADARGGEDGRVFSPEKFMERRTKLGITRKELGARIGVHEATCYYWETSRSAPRIKSDIFDRALSVLDVAVEDVTEEAE